MFPERPRSFRCLLLAVLAGVPAGSASGRQVLHQFDGTQIGGHFGQDVSGAQDVNADGFVDVIVGAPEEQLPGYDRTGAAHAFSGLDGSILHSFTGTNHREMLGLAVSDLTDVNGDGFADLVVSSRSSSTRVFSGRTPGVILFWIADWASALDVAGDVNNDGFPDLVIGRPYPDYRGEVDLVSGRNGARIYRRRDTVDGRGFGQDVAGLGDTNLDGWADFAVGAPYPSGDGPGLVQVRSGQDGSLLRELWGDHPGDLLGGAVSAAGDVDGDGYDDIFAGAPGAGRARVVSGRTGVKLLEFPGRDPGDRFGAALDLAFDLNGDGAGDLAVGAPGAGGVGQIVAYSGTDGAPLLSRAGAYPGAEFGSSVSGLGDMDQDGLADLIVGAPGRGANGAGAGGAVVLSGRCGAATAFGQGCAGSGGFIPRLDVTPLADCFVLGSAVRIEVTGGLGGPEVPVGLLVGLSEGSWTLPSGCVLVVAPPPNSLLIPLGELSGVGNGNGTLFLSTPSLNVPGTVYLQALIDDSFQGLVVTNGVRLTLRP